MRFGKWTLAIAALLIMGGTAMAQIDANRLCVHNGSEYYITGYDHNSINNGVGKYYPAFIHWAAKGVGSPKTWPWKIRGWAWAGMQAQNYGAMWRWGTAVSGIVDNPWSTNMTWDYPLNYCTGITGHTGAPQPIYGSNIPAGVGTSWPQAGLEYIMPSSYGSFNPYLNIFATSDFTFNIPSTAPYYGWLFAATIPAGSAILVPSNTSIYEYCFEQFGPYGQYCLASGDEYDCTLAAGGNKGKNYLVLNIGDSGYFGYFNNTCTGGSFEWDMCVFVDDAITVPVNVPGSANGGNPFAAYGFDAGSGCITPNVLSGSCFLKAMYEDYANPGKGRFLLAGSPWVGFAPYGTPSKGVPYGKAGNRVPHPVDLVTNVFTSLTAIWFATTLPGYPGCMFGSTVGGHSIGVPMPPDPNFKCFELRFSGFSANGATPTASYMVCFF